MYMGFCIVLILNLMYRNMATMPCDAPNCGSIVSKCILTKSCSCKRNNLSCYEECLQCMGKKYFEHCCSCLDLCPKTGSVKTSLSHKSHVEDFEGVPELFDVLTLLSADEFQNNWSVSQYSVNYGNILKNSKFNINRDEMKNELSTNLSVNCTVMYFDHCVSWNKCRQSCRSTGASSYRWFHDGCCECVGSTCLNYGINESRCKFCPEVHQDEFEDLNENNSYEL